MKKEKKVGKRKQKLKKEKEIPLFLMP